MTQRFTSLDIAGIRAFVAFVVLALLYLRLEHRWRRRRFRKNVKFHPVREIGFKQCKPQEER